MNNNVDCVWKKHPYINVDCSTTGLVRNHTTKALIPQRLDKRQSAKYYVLKFGRYNYYVHRLVLQTFKPNQRESYFNMCDHKNRIRTDNNISNLRWSNATLNQLNKGQKNYWKDRRQYQVAIRLGGKKVRFGRFQDESDAKICAKKAQKETYETCEYLYEILDKVIH